MECVKAAQTFFLEDLSRLKLIGFSDEFIELVGISPRYQQKIPSCRPDFLWNEKKISLLELNCDSPAMMTFTDVLEEWQINRLLPEILPITQKAEPNRTRFLYNALLKCFKEAGGENSKPTIAIVDWRGGKTAHELQKTSQFFEEFGSNSFVCDPRDLVYKDGKLTFENKVIDVVQRRVLFPDFVSRKDELKPLLDAYKEGAVCMVNPLRSYICGNKNFLTFLSAPKNTHVFPEECLKALSRTVIPTKRLEEAVIADVIKEQNRWVLKASFSYGGQSVHFGRSTSKKDWQALLTNANPSEWVLQPILEIPQIDLPVKIDGKVVNQPFYANWSPWFFGGEYAGSTTRSSAEPLVSISCRGALHPTVPI